MSNLKRYTIALVEWDSYTIKIEAESEDEAITKAQQNRDENGTLDWKHRDCGTDGFDVIDTEDIA